MKEIYSCTGRSTTQSMGATKNKQTSRGSPQRSEGMDPSLPNVLGGRLEGQGARGCLEREPLGPLRGGHLRDRVRVIQRTTTLLSGEVHECVTCMGALRTSDKSDSGTTPSGSGEADPANRHWSREESCDSQRDIKTWNAEAHERVSISESAQGARRPPWVLKVCGGFEKTLEVLRRRAFFAPLRRKRAPADSISRAFSSSWAGLTTSAV